MMQWASVTSHETGVQIVGNDPAVQRHYFLNLTWEELFLLAKEKGREVTTEEMARMSSRGIRDVMEG